MAAAFAWGALAASSLVLGAVVALRFSIGLRAIGLIMGFGAGVLISAVAFACAAACANAPPSVAESASNSGDSPRHKSI